MLTSTTPEMAFPSSFFFLSSDAKCNTRKYIQITVPIHHRLLTWQFLVTTEGAKCDICVMTIITLARPEITPKQFRLAMLV
jgi:hypothetical protein